MKMHIAPLPLEFLRRARIQGVDDQNQPVRRMAAEGGEPCRDVLRRAHRGEEILLASFCPFQKAGPYKEYGPVFLLASATEEPVDRSKLPLGHGSPTGYFASQLTLRAYNDYEEIIDAQLIHASEAADTAECLLQMPGAAFVHARFPAYGCFACRLEAAE